MCTFHANMASKFVDIHDLEGQYVPYYTELVRLGPTEHGMDFGIGSVGRAVDLALAL
jgi:hypothetical protein